jgi:hypothetical protein
MDILSSFLLGPSVLPVWVCELDSPCRGGEEEPQEKKAAQALPLNFGGENLRTAIILYQKNKKKQQILAPLILVEHFSLGYI